ncbi:hypothetical protein [Photobacterium sp. 53610]|uniref:hypothetical protein n=1 Tax=Photobacterium sp. 53610 TaxID=3102789 RepID=UPI002ED8698E
MQLEQLTTEIEIEVKKATQHPIYGRFLAPLRLMVTWMKAVNTEMKAMRDFMNSQDEDNRHA